MTGDLTIGFVGLGNMGWPMSKRLERAGHTVHCFDINPMMRERAVQEGMTAAESVTEVAMVADLLVLMLPNSEVVESVLVQQNALGHIRSGSLIIDMGSSRPGETRRLARYAKNRGAGYIDAPVSGGVVGARDGQLTIVVGGAVDDVEQVMPILGDLGSHISHVGPSGAGHALKALNNLMSAAHLLVSSEALLIGHRFGLDYEVMLKAINNSSGRSGSTELKWPKYVLPGTYDSGFAISLMAKDMGIAINLADEVGVAAPLSEAATRQWRAAAEELGPDADHTSIVKWLQQRGDCCMSR